MIVRRALLLGGFTLMSASPLAAQQYRVRLDARAQSVSFRGLEQDSIPIADVVPSPSGGSQTPDGHAVRCGAGEYCYYFVPGPEQRAAPVTTSASVVLWGLGVRGLTVRATGRLLADLGGDDAWPATEPAAQLIEGYVEYERSIVIARAGRQLIASRLDPVGFDGGWLRARWNDAALELAAYGGWGLGQAAAIPAPDPALNPLDEWRPSDRQIVAGAEASWVYRGLDLRGEYRREIDPEDNYFVSERSALSFATRVRSLLATGGFDYNIADGRLGSGDVRVSYLRRNWNVSAGARHYRPFFSLWTLWGAFSPVPYNAVNASAEVRPREWLSLRTRGERYRYENADVSTALVPELEDRGWRASAGATATFGTVWTLDGDYHLEHGPGAAGRFADGAVSYRPTDRLAFDVYGGSVARPLELRFYDAKSRWIGGRAEWGITPRHRVWGDVAFVQDFRHRDDASDVSFDQLRVRAGFNLVFGSDADRAPLPPARRPAR